MEKITVKTQKPKEVIDITDTIADIADTMGISDGLCHMFLTHTTAALTTADLDPGTDLDMLDAFGRMVPKLKYRHMHNPAHTPDHILSSVIGTSLSVPIDKGNLMLGTWQRIVLIELDGPREREIIINFIVEE